MNPNKSRTGLGKMKVASTIVLSCLGMAASAKTIALWPLEWDMSQQRRDGRCAIDSANDLSFDTDLVCEYVTSAGWRWTLPPNPDTTEDKLFAPTNGYALYSYGTSVAKNYAYSTTVGKYLAADRDYTLEGWFRFPELPANNTTFFIADCDGSNTEDGNQRWFLTFRNVSGVYSWQIFNAPLKSGDVILYTLSAAAASDIKRGWHHWAITFNHHDADGKAVFKFYQDGILLSTQKWNAYAGSVNCSGFFGLGCRNIAGNVFTGYLDYCRLSDAVLEPEQFLNAGEEAASTVAQWRLCTRNGQISGVPSVGTARLYAGMFTNPWNGNIYDVTKMRPDIDCAFTGNPPNSSVSLPNGNAGCMASIEEVNTSTIKIANIGNDLYYGNDFTVEGWVKIERQGNTPRDAEYHHICGTRLTAGEPGWVLQYFGARGEAYLCLYAQDRTGDLLATTPNLGSLADYEDKWFHLALMYEHAAGNEQQGVWTAYIDGVRTGCATNSVKPRDANAVADFKFGCLLRTASCPMLGKLDCWRISKAALNPSQLMCTPGGAAATDVIALWPFNAQNGIHLDGTDVVGSYTFESRREAKHLVTASADAPDVPDVTCAANGACAFRANGSGNQSYLICQDDAVNEIFSADNAKGWTLECYVKRNEAPVNGNNEFLVLACDPSTRIDANPTLRMNMNYRPTGFWLNVSGVTQSGDVQFKDAEDNPSTIPVGEWTHLALTHFREGTSQVYELYINGGKRGTISASGTPVMPTAIQFGGRNSTENSWRGAMSSIRISKGVRAPADFLCARTRDRVTNAFWPLESSSGMVDLGSRVRSADGRLDLTKSQGVSGRRERARASVPRPDSTPDFIGSRSANVGSVVLDAGGFAESFNGGMFVELDSSFTVEGWLKWQGGSGVVCGTYTATAKGGWKLVMDASGTAPQLRIHVKGLGPCPVLVDGVLLPDASGFLDAWHHIALRYDSALGNGVWSLLVDGVVVGSVENGEQPQPGRFSQEAFRLGAATGDVACAGGYDLWRLSSSVLDGDELLYDRLPGLLLILK